MKLVFSALISAALVAGCASTGGLNYSAVLQPEGASGHIEKPGWTMARFAVAAANPLAAEAGYQILKAGGSAADAAIAVQMVLALVEPQSSGLGGGALLMHFNGQEVEAFDGRETAPSTVDENLFLGLDKKPMAFFDAVIGGRAVGTPGTVRMLEMVHQQHGKLPWTQLFEPAIALAEGGFRVSARLAELLANDKYLARDPAAAAYFLDAKGQPWPSGHLLKNPELAALLRALASQGSSALHIGAVAQAIADKVQHHPTNPGQLSLADLAAYRPKKRMPICHDYQAASRELLICGFPPPSSGAIAIGQILGILARTGAAQLPLEAGSQGNYGPTPSAEWLHLYTQAARLAFADRAQYLADPDFVAPPANSWMSLLDPAYLTERSLLIGSHSMKTVTPGVPIGSTTAFAPMADQIEYGTSHISIVDGYGNALAMTSTIEYVFGSRQMVHGFLLNNELSDFSFAPTDAKGHRIANRVQPGKRPRSSMAPTLVLDKATRQLVISGGSPGGALIIHYTAKTLYGVLNWGLNTQQAINLPNFASLNGPTLLEEKRFPAATVDALKARGHEVREINLNSGLQAIQRTATGFFGGADGRREGVVKGD